MKKITHFKALNFFSLKYFSTNIQEQEVTPYNLVKLKKFINLSYFNFNLEEDNNDEVLIKSYNEFFKRNNTFVTSLREKKERKKRFVFSYRRIKKNLCLLRIFIQKNLPFYMLSLRVTPNNIFANLKTSSENKILFRKSSTTYKYHITKKKLKFLSKLFMDNLKVDLQPFLMVNSFFMISIVASKRIRAFLADFLLKLSNAIYILIMFNKKYKCFNGCRARKKLKKKRKYNILLKY